MQQELLQAALTDLLGEAAVHVRTGHIFVEPATEEEIAHVLAFASQHQLGVVPQGAGSQSHLGGEATRRDIVLSLRRLDQILEYSPADLTVTVQAGTPIRKVQALLQASGQWLALDPAVRDEATIGGLIATNASGPKRLLYGAMRDQVIGMRIVYPDGRIIKTGGKVVKNVAGYDMGKLFIGSLGTLGVITEATFKLRPLPSEQELVFLRPANFADAEKMQRQILGSELIPSCLELLSPIFAHAYGGGSHASTLVVGCDEGRSGAAYQRERLREIAGVESVEFLQGAEVETFWQAYREMMSKPSKSAIQAKVSLLPMEVVPFLRCVTEQAELCGLKVDTSAALGTGIVRLHVAEADGEAEAHAEQSDTLLAVLTAWREWVEQRQGALVIERAPAWLKQNMSVWGTERGEFVLMRGIKQTIDPASILNSGRFVGGM